MNIYKELENPQLAKRVIELLCKCEPDWICEELIGEPRENEYCHDNCEYDSVAEECIVRYIKMQFRHEGKAVKSNET